LDARKAGVVAGLFWGTLITGVSLAGFLEPVERLVRDRLLLLHVQPHSEPRTLIVAIDDASLTALDHPWPFPRRFHADVIRNLAESLPAVIGLDLLVSEPSAFGRSDDEALVAALARAKNVVLPVALASTQEDTPTGSVYRTWLLKPLPILEMNAVSTGLAAIVPDSDRIVRRFRRTYVFADRRLPTFPTELHRIVATRPRPAASLAQSGDVLIDFRGASGAIPGSRITV